MNARLPGVVFYLLAVAAVHGFIATPEAVDWEKVRKGQPEGLSLTLEVPRTEYRQGETIDAKLIFRNASAATYHLWTGTSDRAGRIPDIAFYAVDEKGEAVPDPLRWYFRRGGMSGGLGGLQDLGEWAITLPANEWLRFDKPGTYILRAYSCRTHKGDQYSRKGSTPETRVELVSDPVTISITPLSAADEEQIISTALAQIDAKGKDSQNAVFALWFLGTPSSRAALRPFLTSGRWTGAAMAALRAGPDPAEEAPEILEAVRSGKVKADPGLARNYATLKTANLARTIGDTGQPSSREDMEARGKEYHAAFQAASDEITAAAKTATGGKGPDYYQTVINTLFQDPDKRPQARSELVKVQLDLTSEQGDTILRNWRDFGGEDFLPLVRKLVGAPTYSPNALKALAKLKPTEARPLIIADIQSQPPRYLVPKAVSQVANAPLLTLPAEPIPELEAYFRAQLAQEYPPKLDLLMDTIDRHGTPALLQDVIRFYTSKEGRWACDIQANVLRFWLRYDAPAGVEALKRALAARERTRCYTDVLSEVLLAEWSDAALPVVTAALDDPDPEVVVSAVEVLEARADAKYFAAALSALQRVADSATKENTAARGAARGTAQKLLESTRWKADEAQRGQLLGLGAGG